MKETNKRHDKDGAEVLDPVPMQPPLGYKRAPSLSEQIRQQVIAAKLDELANMEETEDEADDFEVGDDFEPLSPYENDHIPSIKQLRQKVTEIQAEIHKRNLEVLKKQIDEQNAKKGGVSPPAAEGGDTTKPQATP